MDGLVGWLAAAVLSLSVLVGSPAPPSQPYRPDCTRPVDRDEANYCEQRRAAHAAEQSVQVARDQYLTSVWALIGLAGTVVLTGWAAVASTVAARATRRQAKTAQEALVASSRAWLKATLVLDGDFEIYGHSRPPHGALAASIRVKILIENVGPSPALRAHTVVEMTGDVLATTEKLRALAKSARKSDDHNSRLVLPGESYFRPWIPGAPVSELDKYAKDALTPVILGCVTYEVVNDHRLHQTAFAYVLSRVDAHGNMKNLSVGDAPVPKGEFEVLAWAGGFAD